jgi:hypothetical protein
LATESSPEDILLRTAATILQRDAAVVQSSAQVTSSGYYLITESGLGIELSTDIVTGACPKFMLRWSDDGGHTWSNYHTASFGSIGQTSTRAIFRRLGMAVKLRDRVYELSVSDPVKLAITGAMLDVTPTRA